MNRDFLPNSLAGELRALRAERDKYKATLSAVFRLIDWANKKPTNKWGRNFNGKWAAWINHPTKGECCLGEADDLRDLVVLMAAVPLLADGTLGQGEDI